MASNYSNRSEDFDNLFAPRVTTKRADVDYNVEGTDISNRYEKLSRDQEIPSIDYLDGGANLSTFFMGNNSQYITTARINSGRTTQWRVQVIHEIEVTFSSSSARTNFFRYGGRIQWSGSRTGGTSSAKNTDWTNLLSSAGSIELGKTNTYRNGDSTISSIGSDNLTTSYQTLYTRFGSGAYSSNYVRIQARNVSSSVLRFRAIYADAQAGNFGDEYVTGTTRSDIQERRHSSQSAPSYRNTVLLTAGS